MSEEKIGTRSDLIGNLMKKDAELKQGKGNHKQEMLFKEYLEFLMEHPEVAQFSHARIYNMILRDGVSELSEDDQDFFRVKDDFTFFTKHLKGVNTSISEVMEYFKAGSEGLSLGKKVLLLFGPPASGKSSFVEVLKTGLENNRNNLPYRIKGCPINEEPLHLLPQAMRDDFERALGLRIKGDLCPICRQLLKDYKEKHGDVGYYEIPVEQFSISRRTSTGIGRFEPADEKAQDISDITAKENPAITMNPNKGHNHPEAYSFVGAIPRGNRGLVEGVEFVKKGIDTKILWTFINLNEEGLLAVPGSNMPPVSIDTVVVGHCNIVGFKWFAGDPSQEALQSRIFAIPFGYALRIQDEVKIYEKLLKESRSKTHIAPGTLELVALFAVSTRLNPDNSFGNVIEKAKFLDGRVVESIKDKNLDVKAVLARGQASDDWSKRDGMFGVSPRDIMSALSKAVVSDKICKCLTPKKAIAFLIANFDNMMGVNPETLKAWKDLLNGDITKVYKKNVVETLNTAFLSSYGPLAYTKAKKYVEDVSLHCMRKTKLVAHNMASNSNKEPEYKSMQKIENAMGYTSNEMREAARSEMTMLYEAYMRRNNNNFNLSDFPHLQTAVNTVLLEEVAPNMINILTISDEVAGDDAEKNRKKKDDLVVGLESLGYCEHCSREFLEEAKKYLK
jgi:serine protein kinase